MKNNYKRGAWVAVLAAVAVVGAGLSGAKPKPSPPEPARLPNAGLTETGGVTLMLLDVEVRDAQGHPVRGLRKDDFKVKLGLEDWPIYSVDDLCSCADPPHAKTPGPDSGGAPDAGQATETAAPSVVTSAVAGSDPVRYVFFLDFGSLQMSGRTRAFRETRRWIREVKKPADEVMISCYTERRGLVEISPFTLDASRLLEALDRAEQDTELQDPFPAGVEFRAQECEADIERCLLVAGGSMSTNAATTSGCYPTIYCQTLARDEYLHTRNSLLGLRDLLVDLEAVPGRKALIHFQQNGSVYPGRIYHDHSLHADDQVHLMDQIGAEANLSRTAIHGAYAGDWLGASAGWEQELAYESRSLASNLADFTGGTYGRDLNALENLTTAIRQDCACTYRVGLNPPTQPSDRIYTAHVEVRGKPVEHAYHVVFLDEAARWMRQAMAVMRNPEHKSQLSIGAAVAPIGYSEKTGYSVRVQVAFDLDVLAMIPSRTGRTGSWEAGAVLASDDGEQQWDLLSVSSLRRKERPPDDAAKGAIQTPPKTETVSTTSDVVHERVIEGLPSGRYMLRAFVRDRTSLSIGSTSTVLELPPPGRDGLSGPVLFRPASRHLVAGLPLFTKDATAASLISEIRTAEVPAAAPVRSGESVEVVTWICPREARRQTKKTSKGTSGADDAVRVLADAVTSDLQPDSGKAVPLPTPRITRDGACYKVVDALATGTLAPGEYVYAIHWKSRGSSRPTNAEVRFTVQPAAGGQDPGVDTARRSPQR